MYSNSFNNILSAFLIFTSINLMRTQEKFSSSQHYLHKKVCIGTNARMSVPSNRERHYRNLQDRYTNCTYVDGNLELTGLENETLDLSFLKDIREVTGYVLIFQVHVKRIVFPSLKIIRGQTQFEINVRDRRYALFVSLSKMQSIEMPALRDILHGSVEIINNVNLCHVRTIDWDEILTGKNVTARFHYGFNSSQRMCHCHSSCPKGCWGDGPENCQRFSKLDCPSQCSKGRCFGRNPHDCCHLFCAGGCTGPTQRDCLACRNFYDDGECKQECPPMQVYNPSSYSWEKNPNGKYAYGATCVKECPGHLLKDNGACVRACPQNKMEVAGACVLCEGQCPKTCPGVKVIHSGNIDSFIGCNVIEGSLTLLDHSFKGFVDIHPNYTLNKEHGDMAVERLDVLKTVKEITGYVSIQASTPGFTDLSFLENLETIGGRVVNDFFSSLYVVKTSLRSLNLKSLKTIRYGNVNILENKDLCYVDKINWSRMLTTHKQKAQMERNSNATTCQQLGMVCHPECSRDGCWGPGSKQCLACRNQRLEDTCVTNCDAVGIYMKDPKNCGYCHQQCKGGCTGGGPDKCLACQHTNDDGNCVERCPENKYNDNGVCKLCHKNCVNGCTGPENNIGQNGCRVCHNGVASERGLEYCLEKGADCPIGYYFDWVTDKSGPLASMIGKQICRKCHPMCKVCTDFGFHISVCQVCMWFKLGEQCVLECPHEDYYVNQHQECGKCSPECSDGCKGPTAGDCNSCRNYRLYPVDEPLRNTTEFNCTTACPEDRRYKIFPEDGSDPYCHKGNGQEDNFNAIVGGILGCVFLIFIFLLMFCYLWWQRNRNKEAAIKMTMNMLPYDDNEPLKPTNIKPNLANLRIVKETELRKGGILGYGAFGTVYKGVWVPEGENVKIPVAIKVLREGSGTNMNCEILEEAYIMASVDHPNLLQLLAVCMTTQIMLVTQLMPLGCLLDYVRNNKEKVGSKPLLNWCTQIARGMAYLEERRLVHRDLAARNVLVQTPNCVKITDFGLAKLLDSNEDEYKAAGGRMPIKWLALECIQHRIFTHKSDVWAFGVTVWEILTYGGRPYEDIPARSVPDLLEKGERLQQPPICTIDVYMIMIKCWTLDAESRPNFRELAERFAKMARDPGRFLVIQGDKLMRLPSYTPQDERELIRSLSSNIGGDFQVIPAEEYLQPKYGTILAPDAVNDGNSTTQPNTPTKIPSQSDYFENETPQNRHNAQRERKYAHFDYERQGRSQSHGPEPGMVNRYFTDPLKLLDNGDIGDDDCFEPEGESYIARGVYNFETPCNSTTQCIGGRCRGGTCTGTLPVDLPLDEDDYLMPNQQKRNVTEEGVRDTTKLQNHNNITKHNHRPMYKYQSSTNHNPNPSRKGLDNPEYHIMHNHSPHSPQPQPIGVPIPPPNHPGGQYMYSLNDEGPQHRRIVGDGSSQSLGTVATPDYYNTEVQSIRGGCADKTAPCGGPARPIGQSHTHDYYNEISSVTNGQNHADSTVNGGPSRSETTV